MTNSNPFSTHEVLNQPPSFEDVNLFATDAALQDAVSREGAAHALKGLNAFGLVCGSRDAAVRAQLADEQPPRLKSYDAQGRRIDELFFNQAYHDTMAASMAEGIHSSLWAHLADNEAGPAPGSAVARAASLFLAAQMDAGHSYPLVMTSAGVIALNLESKLAAQWLPKILSRKYDPAAAPMADKTSVTLGFGLAEKQSGTDLRAVTTVAHALDDGEAEFTHRLRGHKWFLSAPASDAFVVFARMAGANERAGSSCFLVPRVRPEGTKNAIQLQRLKNKAGNHSNATAEAEFADADAWLLGEEGAGGKIAAQMLSALHLDSIIISAAQMRQALALAIHFAQHRQVSNSLLIDQPLMRHVLADLALDVEAAVALSFRLARAFDRAQSSQAAAWCRLMVPVTKYWVCKLLVPFTAEAMECIGGNAYVNENPMARLYRDAPMNALWLSPGNTLAIDVLSILQREPDAAHTVLEDLGQASQDDPHLRAAHARVEKILHEPRHLDVRARELIEGFAVLAAGTILRAHAPAAVADAFITTRAGSLPRQSYGQGLDWADTDAIIKRASPV